MTTILVENIDLSEARFDTATNELRNVGLIKAGKSLNNRFYSEDVLKKATPIFEGSRAFDSHAKNRKMGELTGWYKNVRYENGGIRADRQFLPTTSGRDVMVVVEAILNGAPRSLAGLSINAAGDAKMQKMDGQDMLVVESITRAFSVDDVVDPAAGGSYTESASSDEMLAMVLHEMTFEEWFQARPEYVKRVQNEMKTVRQDEALKAAKADAENARQALTEAQNELNTLRATHEATHTDLVSVRRELAIEKALRAARLPPVYESDLRETLTKLPEGEWLARIDIEKKKAQRSTPTRTVVTGASQQVSPQIGAFVKRDPTQEMREALATVQSPEDLQRILGQ